ncbi:MAG TPA: hypoxanthine phosphoribosyltransferase [Pyrinomonadaceae bacterium]|nr:hypoxanthine phosphoribosyltransferase [Pyrinomonadaceae bacterium]
MSEFNNPNFDVLFSPEQIAERVGEIGKQIARDYADKELILIGVLKGATLFLSDLMRAIDAPLSVEFMAISSYGKQLRSTGEVKIVKDLDVSVQGKDLVVVEDIVDTGLTLSYLLENLRARGAASVRLAALLDKPDARKREVPIDYSGFQVPNKFLVGYGLDAAERYRNLPFIAVLNTD